MSAVIHQEPQLIHSLPGRLRVHLPGWPGGESRGIERRLHQLQGVRNAQANSLTHNVLIHYDATVTDQQAILTSLRTLEPDQVGEHDVHVLPPPVLLERHGETRRARIPVRGLDSDPDVARSVIEHLEQRPGVRRVVASQLTGRVLVEYAEHEVAVPDLLADIARLESQQVAGEDRPAHPLDSAPLVQSVVRLAGSAFGLGALVTWQLVKGRSTLIRATGPSVVAGVIAVLDSFPAVRGRLDRFLGPDLTGAVFDVASIVSLTLSGSPLGLALRGLEAFQMFTEVRARRKAWRDYERQLETTSTARAGAVIRLETGDRLPLSAIVLDGTGTAIGRSGFPVAVIPGDTVAAGTPVYGGPFRLQLLPGTPFTPVHQPRHSLRTTGDDYLRFAGQISLSYAGLTALMTRSLAQTFAALLLVNRRAALIGMEAATTSTSARVLRSGVTVVGTRPDRTVRLPGVLLLDGPRLLIDSLEVNAVVPLSDSWNSSEILERAAIVATAAGSPWGSTFRPVEHVSVTDGAFDGITATAFIDRERHMLGPVEDWEALPATIRLQHRGDYVLQLQSAHEAQPLGIVALQPRLTSGLRDLVEVCERRGVRVRVLSDADPLVGQRIADRALVPLIPRDDPISIIREQQEQGVVVAFASDSADAAEAFAVCDLAIGVTDSRNEFHARADLIAPDLTAVSAVIEAGARREAVVRDAVILSAAANGTGAAWGFRSRPGIDRASYPVSIAALATLASSMVRMRGGEQPRSAISRLVDPHPERWGRLSTAEVLRALDTTETGLSSEQAAERRRATMPAARQHRLLTAVLDQVRSPLTGILAAGAGLSLFLGATGDVFMIGAMIVANAAAGVWQERQADQAAATLERLGAVNARVMRDGQAIVVAADDVVPGDLLVLARGERVVADARVLVAEGLEVDEAALTGESLPVPKAPSGGNEVSRIVLEGSDVVVGTGSAVVVAVGTGTRLGATAAALAIDDTQGQSVLTTRLSQMLRQFLPLAIAGGAIVTLSGFLRRSPLLPQAALGASIAIAAVPEGLPLLAKVGEAAVGRRLAGRHALVRRLSVVEALGRVDVVCTDKTGTLTEGRLVLRLVTDADQEVRLTDGLPPSLRHVVITAALAGPHPDAPDAGISPTDIAVTQAAEAAGLGAQLRATRDVILPFDATRSFHAALVEGRLCVEGAVEALVARCSRVRRDEEDHLLDDAGQQELLAKARRLAESGLRVLMVAEGTTDVSVDDPRNLTALGFLGISDPLRSTVPAAVRRCHDAGVRVIMLTGDHPTTARVIASEAGLLESDQNVLTGTELAELDDVELEQRLETVTVIARVTPLDKLRIVASLQRTGHTVAMTGDGVNDAPALRLADVGVAMGRGGTEVARQAADIVLTDDDFSTLVEAFVEGRSFWRNIRRALGLLLGGNLGELGLQVGASILSLTSPLTSRQILTVNLITDVLPALAVALQQPEHHNLGGLAREGTSALEAPLRREVVRRGLATAVPSLMSYLFTLRTGGAATARTVAFASIVTTQLAQTLDAGRAEGGLSHSVLGAVIGSAGLLFTALAVSPVRSFLGLAIPTPLGLLLIGVGSIGALLLGRFHSSLDQRMTT